MILTGTFPPDGDEKTPTLDETLPTEERVVVSVRARGEEAGSLKLDKPLGFDHYAEGEFRGEVANLSRNVVVESASRSPPGRTRPRYTFGVAKTPGKNKGPALLGTGPHHSALSYPARIRT